MKKVRTVVGWLCVVFIALTLIGMGHDIVECRHRALWPVYSLARLGIVCVQGQEP